MKNVFGIGAVLIILAGIIGWVLNIIAIVSSMGDFAVTTMFIARCVGVFFAPLGAVLGYF